MKFVGEPAVTQTRTGFVIPLIERSTFVSVVFASCSSLLLSWFPYSVVTQASVLVSMTLVAPPTDANLGFRVASPGGPIACRLQLSAADFLRYAAFILPMFVSLQCFAASVFARPAPITTAVFGQHWTLPGMAEAIVSVPSSTIKTPQQFTVALQEHLHMHPIEVITATSEAIAGARLIGTQQFILIHGQVAPTGLTVRVKSVDAGFSRMLGAIAQNALK